MTAEGQCLFRDPSSNAVAVIYVAIVSALLCVPFLVILEYITMDILSRPTAEPLSSTHPSVAPPNPAVATTPHRLKAAGHSPVLAGVAEASSELKEMAAGLSQCS